MTATTPQIELDELRTLFLFESLTDDVLQWVAERAQVRVFDADVVVFAEGEPSDALWVLLDGGLSLTKHADGEDVVINETTYRGAYSGATRAYATGHPQDLQSTLRTTGGQPGKVKLTWSMSRKLTSTSSRRRAPACRAPSLPTARSRPFEPDPAG